MKANHFLMALLASTLALVSTSCNRNPDEPSTIDAKEQAHYTDSDRVKAESDRVTTDADEIVGSSSMGRTIGTTGNALCGASIDSSLLAQKIISVTYDGTTSCDGFTRSGNVKLQLVAGAKWRDVGAVLEITHTNYKVTRIADNKSMTFNGVKYVTNVQGFNLQTMSRELKERGNNLTITFDDGTQRIWSLARRWNVTITSFNPLIATYTISGDSTLNGVAKTMLWGTNRDNIGFTTAVPTSIVTVFGGACGLGKPLSGKLVHTLDGKGTLTATLGVDANGNPVTSGCPYGYKLEWAGTNNTTASMIKAYP